MNLGFLFLFFEDLFVDFFTLFTKIFNAFDELVVVVLEGGALGSLLIMRKKQLERSNRFLPRQNGKTREKDEKE